MEKKEYKPSGKTFHIKTINQLVNVATAENVDELAKDLYVFLCRITHLFDEMRKNHPNLAKKTNSQIAESRFIWIDDGKDEESLTVTIKETGETAIIKPIKP